MITVILSGGMDSTTLLYKAIKEGDVKALSFNYGQKHSKELENAKSICKKLNVNHKILDISGVKELLTSALTKDDIEVPEGHYAQANMIQTVVPNRNAIMLSIAYGYAVSNGSKELWFGAHSGDHYIYPDCRPNFVNALNKALQLGTEGLGEEPVEIKAPFIDISKSDIVTIGLGLEVPYEETWTCYKGKQRPCLKCGTCAERTETFLDNNTTDPLLTEKEWEEAISFYRSLKV